LSSLDFYDHNFFDYIRDAINRQRIKANEIILEVPETMMQNNPQRAMRVLEQFHALGVRFAIDDFGTGYCSLSHLYKLPVSDLKIDRQFVKGLGECDEKHPLVRSTIQLAHCLGMDVIAEGVESDSELKVLQSMGCDKVQGNIITEPLPGDVFPDWIARRLDGDAEATG